MTATLAAWIGFWLAISAAIWWHLTKPRKAKPTFDKVIESHMEEASRHLRQD